MKNETWSFLGEKIEAGQKAQVMIRPYGEDYEIPTKKEAPMEKIQERQLL